VIKLIGRWLAWIRSGGQSRDLAVSKHVTEATSDGIWSVVANIKNECPYGPGGVEVRFGTRQFRGGTKVYINGCFSVTCDTVVAIGQHRKSRRFITCIVNVRFVENFRVRLAYHPSVIKRIREDEGCWIRTKEEAEKWAAEFPEWQNPSEKRSAE
jgi:hypothetical protein